MIEQLNQQLDQLHWPLFSGAEIDSDRATLTLRVHPELACFKGHFPEQAVLPGVVQIHWAGELARRLFACSGFSELINVKFNGVVLPNTNVTLNLGFRSDVNRIDFSFLDESQTFSSGTLAFTGDL